MQYDGELKLPSIYLVPPPLIERASEQYLVGSGVRIFACSESQKIGREPGLSRKKGVNTECLLRECGNGPRLNRGSSWP